MANKPREVKGEPTDRTLAAPAGAAAPTQGDGGGGDQGDPGAGDGGDPGDESPAAPPAPAPPAPAAEPPAAGLSLDRIIPEAQGRKVNAAELDLLLDCCEKYGINPMAEAVPRELAAWRIYPADRLTGTQAAVIVVTNGGLKIRHNADGSTDGETEERLRNVFGAWTLDKDKQRVPAALPGDCTLPADAVTGLSVANRHRYDGGYLRSGGRAESERRAVERAQQRTKR